MIKKISLLAACVILAACSNSAPPMTQTSKPILNMEAAAAQVADMDLSRDSANVRNKTASPINLAYAVFWYDRLGVTSDGQDEPRWQFLSLQGQQQQRLAITPPNAESQNYRFYLRLK